MKRMIHRLVSAISMLHNFASNYTLAACSKYHISSKGLWLNIKYIALMCAEMFTNPIIAIEIATLFWCIDLMEVPLARMYNKHSEKISWILISYFMRNFSSSTVSGLYPLGKLVSWVIPALVTLFQVDKVRATFELW